MRTILLRTSERTLYKRCRQAWWWAFEEEFKPKTAAPALRFGSLVHKAMERRYKPGVKRGPHPATTFKKLYAAELKEQAAFGFKDEDGKWEEAGDLGVAMLNNFVDTFGDDNRYEVIASEQAFQVEVLRTKSARLVYVGIFDGVWRDRENGRVYLIDWKTAASISTGHLSLDEQAGSYWAYGPQWLKQQGIVKSADLRSLSGILYTFMRKASPDLRPKNEDGLHLNKPKVGDLRSFMAEHRVKQPPKGSGSGKGGLIVVDDLLAAIPARLRQQAYLLGEVSKDQPPDYFHREPVYRSEADAASLRARVISEAKEMAKVRKGELDVFINPSPMNCGGCGYKDMCELKESGADWESYRDAAMQSWEPYAEHEQYAAETK